MKIPRLYSKNQDVLECTAIFISLHYGKDAVIRQNELFCLIEDIKFPFLTHRRVGNNPSYAADKNYMPIVRHLLYEGILTKYKHPGSWNSRVDYHINKEDLAEYVSKINV